MDQLSLITVIIVSFNTKEKLRRCLSCLDMGRYEVIVVDNASVDGSADMVSQDFPSVNLIASDVNLGFSAGNNLGLDHSQGDLILFLNSDAYAKPGAVEELAKVFNDEKVVAAGGRLLNLDGSLQESVAGRLTLLSVFLEQTYLDVIARKLGLGYWKTKRLPSDKVSQVAQVMGACLMMRKGIGERFDDRFFLYCEDTELCSRLACYGPIVYVPQAEFLHELGSSSTENRWLAVARYNIGKELYFRINYGRTGSSLCWLLNRFGALLRVIAGVLTSFRESGRIKREIFVKVLLARYDQVIPRVGKPR